ncbi:proline-rich protein 2-like [Meles meles]|uniref:proline-rich protein 2-like n=1 Tax=Meles meles TaxID=9662 RepID=UPI001E69CDE5|nr:proline-rich protein 2-like [Meles meles]
MLRDPHSEHARPSPGTRTHEEGTFPPPERAGSGRGALQADPGLGVSGPGGSEGPRLRCGPRTPVHAHPHRTARHRTAPHRTAPPPDSRGPAPRPRQRPPRSPPGPLRALLGQSFQAPGRNRRPLGGPRPSRTPSATGPFATRPGGGRWTPGRGGTSGEDVLQELAGKEVAAPRPLKAVPPGPEPPLPSEAPGDAGSEGRQGPASLAGRWPSCRSWQRSWESRMHACQSWASEQPRAGEQLPTCLPPPAAATAGAPPRPSLTRPLHRPPSTTSHPKRF